MGHLLRRSQKLTLWMDGRMEGHPTDANIIDEVGIALQAELKIGMKIEHKNTTIPMGTLLITIMNVVILRTAA